MRRKVTHPTSDLLTRQDAENDPRKEYVLRITDLHSFNITLSNVDRLEGPYTYIPDGTHQYILLTDDYEWLEDTRNFFAREAAYILPYEARDKPLYIFLIGSPLKNIEELQGREDVIIEYEEGGYDRVLTYVEDVKRKAFMDYYGPVFSTDAYTRNGSVVWSDISFESLKYLNPYLKFLLKPSKVSRKTISQLKPGDYVEIRATLVKMITQNPTYLACPRCFLRVQQKYKIIECYIHGEVEPIRRIGFLVILDDGTGDIKTSFGKEIAEQLLQMSIDEAFRLGIDLNIPEVPLLRAKQRLEGQELIVQGRVGVRHGCDELHFIIHEVQIPTLSKGN